MMAPYLKLTINKVKNDNKSRTRKQNPFGTKAQRAKLARDRGLPHTSKINKENKGREIPGGKTCGDRCQKPGCLLSDGDQEDLFTQFWEIGDWDKQRTFLISCMDKVDPAERTTVNPTSRRNNTFKYFVKVGGERLSCCRETILSLFDVTENEVRHVQDLLTQGVIVATDARGQHPNRPNRVTPEIIDLIKSHINQYPKYISHYSREKNDDDERRYLHPDLTIEKMFREFVLQHRHNDRVRHLRNTYRRIMREMKLTIGEPKQDTCKTCDAFKIKLMASNSEDETRKILEERVEHHNTADGSYREMREDFLKSQQDESLFAIAVDLQQVLFCPTLTHGDVFYKRQFASYNFCIYDAKSNNASMCFWSENEAKRGCDEIGSCTLRFFREKFDGLPPAPRKLIVWSDRCVGQNNNFFTIALYKYFVHLGYFTEVEQKFLTTGHTFLPCDRMFALIEKNKRGKLVSVPEEWIPLIVETRIENPFHVQRMTQRDFFIIKDLLTSIPCPNSLKVTDLAVIRLTKEFPSDIFTKEEHNDEEWISHRIVNPHSKIRKIANREDWTADCLKDFQFKIKYHEEVPISEAKKNDLLDLSQAHLLPEYRGFYTSLKAVKSTADEN